jgi:glycosyltransferase involved in cell wall biosynthesis
MRILYHHRIRAEDGQAVHVRELIAALRRQGHEVLECALVTKADAARSVTPGAEAAGRGGLWQRLRLPRVVTEILEMLYNAKGRSMLRKAAKAFRPDVIYERYALHCRAGLDVAREIGVPLLLEVNSPMVQEMETLGLLRFRRRALATERAVLAGADRVFAVTRVLADILLRAGGRADAIEVIPNGAVLERYGDEARQGAGVVRDCLGLGADAFLLGFVGFMRPWHRLDLVLEAMQRPGLAALHLMLCGDGPALEGLLQKATELGVSGRVHAMGKVAASDLPRHVLACDAALIPAINEYASPLKLFDSLAAGVVTLAPDQPNLRETLVDGRDGVLFRPGCVDSLAQALEPLVADRSRARAIGAQGLRRLVAEDWTWDGNARRVAAAFEVLARRRSA